MLGNHIDLKVFQGGSVHDACYCVKILLPLVSLFKNSVSPEFLFIIDNVAPHHTAAIEKFLESGDIQRMDWHAKSQYLNSIGSMRVLLGRHLASRAQTQAMISQMKLALE